MNLQISQNSSNTQSFTARAPQVRDAQWVCRKVHSFPHISPSKLYDVIETLKETNPQIFIKSATNSTISRIILGNSENIKLIKIYTWYKRIVNKVFNARSEWDIGGKDDYKRVGAILGQFKHEKVGNCGEDTYLAASILRMNGVENASIARMYADGQAQDHVVCILNKDGSPFDNKNLKKSIVIDPWLGIADFASNVCSTYKNVFNNKFYNLKPYSEIKFKKLDRINFSDEELQLLRRKHPELCYPKTNREFMQKK